MASAGAATAEPRADLRNYVLVTGAYWTDTLVDGASRMLVLFYFDQLGYSPFQLATLFVLYEFFGIVTNLVGGWVAARFGLKTTLFMGLGVQICAQSMLGFAPEAWLVVPYVMGSQALSGIAKDLTKMSSKSAVKLVVPEGQEGALYKWVAILTGSKNALKGVGFFLGGLLLTLVGFQTGVLDPGGMAATALVSVSILMRGQQLGRPNAKAKFKHMFSNNRAVNILAAARIFLFASRDVWFVVGLPVFLYSVVGWNFWQVGALSRRLGHRLRDRPGLGARASCAGGPRRAASPTAGPRPGWPSPWRSCPPASQWRSRPTPIQPRPSSSA